MLSSVFLMQPVGQAVAQLVGVWVLLGEDAAHDLQEKQCGINSLHHEECKSIADGIWRIVIGSGAVPALLAIIFRFFLYDCGLYTLEVKNKPGNAFRDTQRVYGAPPVQDGMAMIQPGVAPTYSLLDQLMPVQFSWVDLQNYFIRDKNWIYLLGTSMTWFFLDVSFYGFSLDNRGTLSDLWATTDPVNIDSSLPCWESALQGGKSLVQGWNVTGLPTWQTDATHPCNTIYDTLLEQSKQYLLTVSIASIAGSACFIFAANRIPRRQWLTTSFIVLTILFLVTGGVYYGVAHRRGAPATVALVAVCHFMFNFGEPSYQTNHGRQGSINLFEQAPTRSPSSSRPRSSRRATGRHATASPPRPENSAASWPWWSCTASTVGTRARRDRVSSFCSSPPSWPSALSARGPTYPTSSALSSTWTRGSAALLRRTSKSSVRVASVPGKMVRFSRSATSGPRSGGGGGGGRW